MVHIAAPYGASLQRIIQALRIQFRRGRALGGSESICSNFRKKRNVSVAIGSIERAGEEELSLIGGVATYAIIAAVLRYTALAG